MSPVASSTDKPTSIGREMAAAACEVVEADALPDYVTLYRHYFPKVFTYVYRRVRNQELAFDITSQIFEMAFADPACLQSEEAFRIALFSIARRAAPMRSQKKTSAESGPLEAAWREALVSPSGSANNCDARTELTLALLTQMRHLDQDEQDVLALKFDVQLANNEIAQVTGTSEGRVALTLLHALQKLQRLVPEAVA